MLLLLALHSQTGLYGQRLRVHAHNDYEQSVPFWKSYAAGVDALEVDVFLKDGVLLVGHELSELSSDRSMERLYLKPLLEVKALDLEPGELQLLIDIKTEAYSTLEALVQLLGGYPSLTEDKTLRFVISGNRPSAADYPNYPGHILFDHQDLKVPAAAEVRDKIALLSLPFARYSRWNGLGRLTQADRQRVQGVIDSAHLLGKPFRFWGSPDSKTAWKAMADMGVDYINTDKPFECVSYVNSLSRRVHEQQKPMAVYRPDYSSDGAAGKPQNIILFIGDGNGLAQISAAAVANRGELSLTQLRHMGLISTHSDDDFTTDSAAGATAYATGKRVPNRAIGVDARGQKLPNLVELLSAKGYLTGIISSDAISGATPASFYAHQADRDMEGQILDDLQRSPLHCFVSSPTAALKVQASPFRLLMMLDELDMADTSRWAYHFPTGKEPADLSAALDHMLRYFDRQGKPFFLVVEGAKIDSYGHSNKISNLIAESFAFDEAIAVGLAFADAQKNTLLLVTADHETGGLSLPQGDVAIGKVEADFSTNDHSGIMVPIFAYGPRAQLFQGVFENQRVFHKIGEALELDLGR